MVIALKEYISARSNHKSLKRKKETKASESVFLNDSDFHFTDLVCSSGLAKILWWVRRPLDLMHVPVASRWFSSSNGQEWRLHLVGNQEERAIGLELEASSFSDLLPQRASFTFRVHFFNKKTNKFGRNINKSYEDTFTREILIIGAPKLVPLTRYGKQAEKGMFVEVHLRPSATPDQCREIAGFVGLVNEGTTCYMNSLLQTLFLLTAFRQELYRISLPESDEGNIPRALRKLFAKLQLAPAPPSTQELLISFGWGREQWHIQHDAQEFNYTLSSTLEQNFRHTSAQNIYDYLFKGQMVQMIDCTRIKYRSETREEFIDLQLDVKDCATLYDSFRKYTEEVLLTGESKYEAGRFGKQDARKSVRFIEMPRVLQIHLKRFEYNHNRGVMTKLNQELEFFEEINLDDFVVAANQGDNTYRLFSIIVHSGTLAAGHYYAFINPQLDGNWLKFNDESVEKAVAAQAIQGNFGGERKDLMLSEKGEIKIGTKKSDTSAYMLIYIKTSCIAEVLPLISDEEIPISLQSSVIMLKENKREQRRAKPQYCDIALCDINSLKDYSGPGIPTSRDYYCLISVQRESLMVSLIETLGEICLWSFKPGIIDWKFTEVDLRSKAIDFQTNFDYVSRALFIDTEETVLQKQEGKWRVLGKGNNTRASVDNQVLLFIKVCKKDIIQLVGYELVYENTDFNQFQAELFQKYLDGKNTGWICLEKADSDFLKVEDLDKDFQQLRSGDCILLGTDLQGNMPSKIMNIMCKVSLKAIYIDSQESFGQRSFSKSLFSTAPNISIEAKLNDSQGSILQKICKSIGRGDLHWEQIMLLYKDHSVVPTDIPDFNLIRIIDNYHVYFDLSEFRFSELIGRLLLRFVLFNANFHPLQFHKRIVNLDITVKEIRALVKGFMERKKIGFSMFLYNFKQRSLLKYIRDRDNLGYLVNSPDIAIGITLGGIPSNMLQVIQVFNPEEGAERPLFIEIEKNDTCSEVADEIFDKTNSEEDVSIVELDDQVRPTRFLVVGTLPESDALLLEKCPSRTVMLQMKKQRMKIQ